MTYMELSFILVLLVNTIVSLVYLIWNITHVDNEKCAEEGRDNSTGYILKSVVMFICPVVGSNVFLQVI